MQGYSSEADFVFVSYSHDSQAHKDRVRDLAARLIENGVPTELDQYNPFPQEGWPAWMTRRIAEAQFVLAVCTETYYNRAMGHAEAGIGRGAAWESQIITQVLYDAQGSNDKFIPVVFDEACRQYVPLFLRPYTTPNVSSPDGFVELLRLLTNQPAYPRPTLGERISLPPITTVTAAAENLRVDSSGDLVLLHPADNGFFWVDAEEIAEDGNTVRLTLKLESTAAVAEARKLSAGMSVGIAYENTAFLGDLRSVQLLRRNQSDQAHIEIRRSSTDYGVFMEPSLNDLSADAIANLRVRRILLDEVLPPPGDNYGGALNAATLEVFVRGMGAPIKTLRSPIPMIHFEPGMSQDDREAFLAVARLTAILLLRLSGAIEVVERLAMELNADSVLSVSFSGLRPRKYANAEPSRIVVDGSFNVLDARSRRG
jgi:hypothetical protein